MIKLSIIIPYYNTYELTVKLLKQLEIQKTDEVEIILVDDGCNETRFDEYKFVKVIHNKVNINAPRSWNKGIKIAKGEYIGFIDSDDMIFPNYIEELIQAIDLKLADEIQFGWMDATKNFIVTNPKNVAVWKAIYKKDKCPMFREQWKYRSDVPFQADLAGIPHTKCLLNKTLYLYNSNRVGSLTWERLHNPQPNRGVRIRRNKKDET